MLNANRLSEALRKLVYDNKEQFKTELASVTEDLDLDVVKQGPLMIYTRNRRNAIYYAITAYLSIKADKILEFASISGQNLISQYFLTEETRDKELWDSIYYDDITFIYLSQYDYTNDFLENLIMSLIDFRTQMKKATVVLFDIQSEPATNTATMAKKLYTYFKSNGYNTIDITKKVIAQPSTASKPIRVVKKGPLL